MKIHGYHDQTEANIALVNANKLVEEELLRKIDELNTWPNNHDSRWLTIARIYLELGFMCWNRAILQPQRVELTEKEPQ